MKYILILLFIGIVSSLPSCKVYENYCTKCNSLTNLCIKCEKEVFIPDEEGGCIGKKSCTIGKNYCQECENEENICKTCSLGYYPDEIGGCTNTENCEVSYLGNCLKCKNDFVLIGQGIKFCKSLNSEDFIGCKSIDYFNGHCKDCEEDYFLNEGDKKCITTSNCFESIYDKCISCISNYYLDINEKNECKSISGNEKFLHCKETDDGEKCTKCVDEYYLTEDNICVSTNFCSTSSEHICTKCIDKYYLSKDKMSCTKEKNCERGEKDSGICTWCNTNYYLDAVDGKCKSNQEDDELKYCKFFTDKCTKCEVGYELGEDSQCSNTKFCSKSEFGICNKCIEDYYLDKDHKCTGTEHCIRSQYNSCVECEDGFYYNKKRNICSEAKGVYENCVTSDLYSAACQECKIDYYLSLADFLCHKNDDIDGFYKCAEVDEEEKECTKCIPGYYLGLDSKCTITENCEKSQKGKCIECDDPWYCLDVKREMCVDNEGFEEEEDKICFKCLKTNEDGTSCEECKEDYILGESGLCIDKINCEEEEDDTCIKCKNKGLYGLFYCLNKSYGCVETYLNKNCLRCDDDLDFDKCTQCREGYTLDDSGFCDENE